MGKSNDKIDKLDEQIKSLMNEDKTLYDNNNGREVIIDRKYEYDDVNSDGSTTKKLDVIENIESNNNDEDTKKIETISDIEENVDDDNENNEKIGNKEEDNIVRVDDIEENQKEESSKIDNGIDVDFADVKKSNGIIWIALSIFVVLILIIALALFMISGNDKKDKSKKEETDVKETLTKGEQKEIINKYGDALQGVIAMNIEKDNKLIEYNDAIKLIDFDYNVECSVHEVYKDGNIYLTKCKIDDLKTNYSYGEKQEENDEDKVEDDDSIKVYVSSKNGDATLTEPKKVDDYEVFSFNIDGKYSNLTLLNSDSDYVFYYDEDNNVQMINYKKNRKALSPMTYTSILPIKYDGMFDSNVVAVLSGNKWGLYNLDSRERIIGHKFENVSLNLNGGVSGPPLYIDAIEKGKIAVVEDGDVGVINYNNGSEIIPIRYSSIIRSGNYLWLKDEKNTGYIFDFSGKEYLNSFDEIYGIVDGSYVLAKDGNDLKLVRVNGKTYFNYGEVEYGDYSFGMKYKDGAIFQFYKPNSSDSCLEVIYDNSNKTGEVKDITCGAIDISK